MPPKGTEVTPRAVARHLVDLHAAYDDCAGQVATVVDLIEAGAPDGGGD